MSSSPWLQVDPGPGPGWKDKAKKLGWEQTAPQPWGPCSAVAESHQGAVRMEPEARQRSADTSGINGSGHREN